MWRLGINQGIDNRAIDGVVEVLLVPSGISASRSMLLDVSRLVKEHPEIVGCPVNGPLQVVRL